MRASTVPNAANTARHANRISRRRNVLGRMFMGNGLPCPDSIHLTRTAATEMLRPHDLPKHVCDGFGDDHQIQPEGALLDVLDVVLDPFLKIAAGAAGAIDLPQSGDAGADAEARLAPRRTVLVLVIWAGA